MHPTAARTSRFSSRHSDRSSSDRGSAVVEFVLIAPLLIVLALAVVQVALLMHARATLTSAAAEGARAGAISGADLRAGISRATVLVEQNMNGAVVRRVSAEREVIDGLAVLTVRINAEVPGLGMLGATRVDVEGHALIESVQ